MRDKSVMIRVKASTRDRLAQVLKQIQRARGGRRRFFGVFRGRYPQTLDAALVELLDRHDRHGERNKRAAAAKRAKRKPADDQAGVELLDGDQARQLQDLDGGEGGEHGAA